MKINHIVTTAVVAIILGTHWLNAKDAENFTLQLTPPIEKREMIEPIEFTTTGVHNFIKQTYNNFAYGRDFLPNNFDHVLQFLSHSKKTNQSSLYIKSVLRMFSQKLKGASYVNAFAFSDMLGTIGDLLEHQLTTQHQLKLDHVQEAVNEMLYNRFLTQYNEFKLNPKNFLSDLSLDLTRTVAHDQLIIEEQVNSEQLRQSLIRFLEIGLNKLIWNPTDYQDIWQSFTTISRQLTKLQDRGIVKELDDLDDLYWSLVHRFCGFVETMATDLPVAFYEEIKQNMAQRNYDIFALEEQDEFMTPKAEHLMVMLTEAETKARAKQFGIITLS